MADRIAQLKALLEREPSDPFCMYGIGMEYARMGQHDSAVAWFDYAIEADPDYAYAYYHKAKSHQLAGDNAAARRTLEVGLERAQAAGDAKAMNEIAALLDEVS